MFQLEPNRTDVKKVTITLDYRIRNEKVQYNLDRESAKIYASSSGESDKQKYLKGEKTLPPDQSGIIEQAKITNVIFGKELEKQSKMIEKKQEKKQVEALQSLELLKSIKDLISKDHLHRKKIFK